MASANKCPTCQGKFGMARQYVGRQSFCRQLCKEDFLKQRQQSLAIQMHLLFCKERPPDEQYELPLPDS